jgi:hypothetical protein
MTKPTAPNPRGRSIAQIADIRPFAGLAVVGAIAGVFWFPIWFLTAQMVRLWSTRGGLRWLGSRGVAEYDDEKIATVISLVPILVIAARVIVGVNWLQPFQVLDTKQLAPTSPSDLRFLLDIVLGIALSTAFTGVMVTRRLPMIVGLVGFAAVATLSVAAARGIWWQPNGIEAVPLALLGYVTSKIATVWDNHANRRYEQKEADYEPPADKLLSWTSTSRTKR